MQSALGLAESGGAPRLAQFVGKISVNPASANELAVRLEMPVRFHPPKGGKAALGYDAELLADICDLLLEARRKNALTPRYLPYAERAEILMAAWARIGLVAMIDEVTGFQYISDKLMKWTKTFPDDFYIGIFRLKGWDYTMLKPGDRKPSCIGRYGETVV
jgi:hypothetical protein